MLVQMKTHIGGYRDGVEWPPPGGTIDVPAYEAADLIANGYAAAVRDEETGDAAGQDPSTADQGGALTTSGAGDTTGADQGDKRPLAKLSKAELIAIANTLGLDGSFTTRAKLITAITAAREG